MKLNENLQICLLATANRHLTSTMDLNEEVIGPQCPKTGKCTPSGLLELLQSNAPQMLSTPAQLVVDAQKSVIYLVEQSPQVPAFGFTSRAYTRRRDRVPAQGKYCTGGRE